MFLFTSRNTIRRAAGLQLAAVALAIMAFVGCSATSLTTTPTATATASPTATATATPTAIATPTPTSSTSPIAFGTPSMTGDATLTTAQVVKLIGPSVVHIQTSATQRDFFNRAIPVEGAGTGIVLTADGYIGTNNHVVAGADTITVGLIDGRSFDATVVGTDPQSDLAVIKIEATDLQPVQFADPAQLEVGDDVVAIGHALDLQGGPTVTKGVVSAKNRSIAESNSVTLDDLVQTDAAINPGNSGGPLLNMAGQVVGINTLIDTSGQNIGFAIGAGTVRDVVQQLMQNGVVARGYLGTDSINITPALARAYGLAVSQGIGVQVVEPGSPAQAAGIQAGDIIVKIDDTDIANSGELANFLRRHLAGETVDVTLYRGSSTKTIQVTLGTSPS